MKKFVIIVLLFTCINASENTKLQFQYGLLQKPIANPDTIYALEDSSIIYTEDEIRLNVAYHPKTYFYVYFVGTDKEITQFYNGYQSDGDTLFYDFVLSWIPVSDPPGLEQFYFINSTYRLQELEDSYAAYSNSTGKFQERQSNILSDILENLDPNYVDMAYFDTKLDDPITGGVTFRGEDENKIHEFDVTHTFESTKDIAVKKITLIHK